MNNHEKSSILRAIAAKSLPDINDCLEFNPRYNRDSYSLYLGDFDRIDSYSFNTYYLPPLLQGSDYCGSTVERSNCRVFLEEFGHLPGIHEVYGGFGSYGVAIHLSAYIKYQAIRETLNSLSDYPAMNDEDISLLEAELLAEAWENFIRHDVCKELENYFQLTDSYIDNDLSDLLSSISDSDFLVAFHKVCDITSNYPEFETGCSVFVRIEPIIPAIAVLIRPILDNIIDPTKPDAIQLSLEI